MILKQPCYSLPGVGQKFSKLLNKCGINSIQDLILHLPFRYQDRTRITPICDLLLDDWAVVCGTITRTHVKKKRRPILECDIQDKTGLLKITFFHFYTHQLQAFKVGAGILLFGEIRTIIPYPQMIHPEYHLQDLHVPIHTDETLTPIYATTEGLTQKKLRFCIQQALNFSQAALQAIEWMPPHLLEKLQFYSFYEAITYIHHPPPDAHLALLEHAQHPAIKRLIFEELLSEKIRMILAKAKIKQHVAHPCYEDVNILSTFLKQLPFTLTRAQQRVLEEIKQDLSQNKPMLRLIQGDVGSGKTIVAAIAALQVIASGYQVALMVPTDLLSEQHTQNIMAWFKPLGIDVQRLHGKLTTKLKKTILASIAQGTCQCIIGTHALFQEKVCFKQLALVIIDEQHRFGVEQRIALVEKGKTNQTLHPHQLLLTATPIPRTLRMTQWDYLDISTIDERPPHRSSTLTVVMPQDKRHMILKRLDQAITSGRQAYWVCPLIESSEKQQIQTATATYQALQQALPHRRIALIHSRIKEKEQLLITFKNGHIDLLVATTVIEVGVDVPNASLMIVDNSERLGLAQLHQLRGRIGRGHIQSYCILLYQPPLSPDGIKRLHTLRQTHDGFIIAEQDLKLRGAGELLGAKQSGYKRYKIAHPARDAWLLPQVARIAHWLIKTHPEQALHISEQHPQDTTIFLKG